MSYPEPDESIEITHAAEEESLMRLIKDPDPSDNI
jgi:hypothetical protein